MACAAVALVPTKTGGGPCLWAQVPGKNRVGISASSEKAAAQNSINESSSLQAVVQAEHLMLPIAFGEIPENRDLPPFLPLVRCNLQC